MAHYIEFLTSDGNPLLVEIEQEEVAPPPGVEKAGLQEKAEKAVAVAMATFEGALGRAVRYNAEAFIHAVHGLPEQPSEAEMAFALKATGELGNVAVGKVGSEANYSIKLVWKKSQDG